METQIDELDTSVRLRLNEAAIFERVGNSPSLFDSKGPRMGKSIEWMGSSSLAKEG